MAGVWWWLAWLVGIVVVVMGGHMIFKLGEIVGFDRGYIRGKSVVDERVRKALADGRTE